MKNKDEMFCLDTNTFNEGLGIPPYQRRSIEADMATTGKEIASMIASAGVDQPCFTGRIPTYRGIEDTRRRVREYMEAASSPFAIERAPKHNNELLLLL
jgi:hypothetical protein